jgi:hypothetical protein
MNIYDFTSKMGMIIARTLTVGNNSSSFHLDQSGIELPNNTYDPNVKMNE